MEASIHSISPKWHFASSFAAHAELPNSILQYVFDGIVNQLEQKAETIVNSDIQNRVWKKVSQPRLNILKEHFISDFYYKVLGHLNDDLVEEMMDIYNQSGEIPDIVFTNAFTLVKDIDYNEIVRSLTNRAHSLEEGWEEEIMRALINEDIVFP